eukprot:3689949-Amphidinium_carterae.2
MLWISWSKWLSALGVRCSGTRQVLISAAQRLDVGQALLVSAWSLLFVTTQSIGLLAKLVTNKPQEQTRGFSQAFSILIIGGLMMTTTDFQFGDLEAMLIVPNLISFIIIGRAWVDTSSVRCHPMSPNIIVHGMGLCPFERIRSDGYKWSAGSL